MPKRAPAAIAIIAAFVVAACGNDTVDADKVEAGIEQDLSNATTKIVSVSCKDDVEQKKVPCQCAEFRTLPACIVDRQAVG